MQALTLCDANHEHTRATAGQFKSQFSGAMDEMSGKFKMRALTYCDAKITSTCTTAGQIKGQFKGAMEEMSGQKVQKANTLHIRCTSSRDVQPNQLGRPARLYVEDPAPTLGIEHHAFGHLRLDCQRAVDADR